MAFSASTCLTDLSGANLTDPIKFYSDVNNFLFEFNSANLSQLTGTSCPFILTNIPDGTKVVKIVSENNYCANIDVEKLDCGFFDFQLVTNNDVSRIIAAALKSSNVEPTDYKINCADCNCFLFLTLGFSNSLRLRRFCNCLVSATFLLSIFRARSSESAPLTLIINIY
jgi:hypothetical protein